MTIWGGFNGHMRVGLDIWTDGYDTWTPSINVYVQVSVQCDSTWNFDDNQQVNLGGSVGGSWAFHNGLQKNGLLVLGTAVIPGQGQNYGGGPTYTFHAELVGNYLGPVSVVDANFTLPARPIRPPSQTYPPDFHEITATRANATWRAPDDGGGAGLDYSWFQLGLTNFGNLVSDWQMPGWSGRSLSGLAPATVYFGRAAAHTAGGWGAFSGVSAFTTAPYQPAVPWLSDINPDSVIVHLGAPGDPDGPANYHLQWTTDPNWNSLNGGGEVFGGWTTAVKVTGLNPASKYYFRVRANPGTGWGVFSGTGSATTLSGAKVLVNGQWVNGVAYVRSNGAWVLAKVWKRSNGAWVL